MKHIISFAKKITARINDNFVLVLAAWGIFFIPFFWFAWGEVDLGGDSSRLYFYDPWNWMKNIALNSNNPLDSLGADNPNFFIIPFLLLLSLIKLLMGNSHYLLNCTFAGLILSGGFLAMYGCIRELSPAVSDRYHRFIAVIGAMFFIFSPVIVYEWLKAPYHLHYVFVYPLIFYLFLKYLKTGEKKHIVWAAVVSFVFSINFSYVTSPWFFSYFPFAVCFLFGYSVIHKKTRALFQGAKLFIILFLLVQLFHLLPQTNNVLDPANVSHKTVFSREGIIDRGLGYFNSVQPYVSLISNLTNQSQYRLAVTFNHPTKEIIYDYGIKYQYLFFLYPLIVLLGVLLYNREEEDPRQRKIFFILVSVYVVLTFFITANVGEFFVNLYKKMFALPGFAMFRSFFTKFSMSFVFFYSLLLSLSLIKIVPLLKHFVFKYLFLGLLAGMIVFNGWPFISGQITRGLLWLSKDIPVPIKMNEDYVKVLDLARQKKLESKYLSFPLTNERYSLLKGQEGGAYFGPSSLAILAGKGNFNGIGSFNYFNNEILSLMMTRDHAALRNYFSLFNIGYILHDADEYIYSNFPTYPYSEELKKKFPDQEAVADFIQNLHVKQREQIGNFHFHFTDHFVPRLFIPQEIFTTVGRIERISRIASSDSFHPATAVFFRNEIGRTAMERITRELEPAGGQDEGKYSITKKYRSTQDIRLEFKKVSYSKYRVRVHRAKGVFPLVFSENFHSGWKVYLNRESEESIDHRLLGDYRILPGNEGDQASKEELIQYIARGQVSHLGNGKEKKYQRLAEGEGDSAAGQTEKYTVDFISRDFHRTVQNENLPDGAFWETWFQDPIMDQRDHITANGYANSWIVDSAEICQDPGSCFRNDDGSYDFELVIELWPQRLFYFGMIVSGLTMLGCLAYLIRVRKARV